MAQIEGVQRIPLTRHADDRGYLVEILRADDPHFDRFGQVYVSLCRRGFVKAWHAHERQTDRFCVVSGTSKIGLWDGRGESPTCGQYDQVILGDTGENVLLIVPPLVWHGFAAVGGETAVVLNVPTEHYNAEQPDELRRDLDDPAIDFDWFPRGG
jgi:dTDP-4-dehydrorhamnose 3,5-epimerase